MLTTHRLSLLSLSLLLLFGLSLRASAADLPLPLETMPGQTLVDVKDRAAAESTAGPVWGNAPSPADLPVHQTFRGTVTADARMTKLAIFSDDGCDVYVDGTLVWSARDKGQALPDLPNSLHELPVTLIPGDHSVQIDYSNVIYTVADASKGIPPDIDGCTLFQYGPIPVVHVSTGNKWQPNPAAVGQTITAPVTAQVDNPPIAPSGHHLSEHWVWTTGGVYQSPNGASGSFVPCNGYIIAWSQTGSATQFSGIFNSAGYYIIKVTASVAYHDDDTNSDLGSYSGVGYIGGVASDISSSPGAAPATAKARAAAAPAAAGTTTGVPVIQIAKLQYAYGTSGTFADVTNPIYVDAGTTVVFKAIPSTPGASFPTGQPQWSGVKGTASGDTDIVVFTTLNKTATPADYQTVTATFGTSTVTANVVVQGVTITTSALADQDPSTSSPTPLLKRVNVNGTDYGSGTTLSLVVTPVNGFKGKVTLDVDRGETNPDIFGLKAAAIDSHDRSFKYSFYEPVYRKVSDIESPSTFTLDFSSDSTPKSVILTLTLDSTYVMDAGNYQATVFANPNEQGNTRMGSELALPVTVVEHTAPRSDSFSGGAHDGLYKVARSYSITGSSVGKSKSGVQYDALQGTLTLPSTAPDSTSLNLDYQSGDAYDIYSGGLARSSSTGRYSEMDIGLFLGHTGNQGYSTTGNYVTPADGTNKTRQRGPVASAGSKDSYAQDQILPGSITFTFEAPGYQDSVYGTVPENEAYLVIQGATISPGFGKAAVSVPTRKYRFVDLPLEWKSDSTINVKYTTSIAQTGIGGTVTYNGPPNLDKSPNATKTFFYTSGSKAPYVSWGGLTTHVQGTKAGFAPINLPADETAPGNPYVNPSILNTVP